jgi:hypothetical protein
MEFIKVNENDGLNYKVVKRDLLDLFEATANNLEQQWDARYANVNSARTTFTFLIRIATNTYQTIMYTCADEPEDAHRKPEFALSVVPMVRSLFEELIMILFLLEDIPNYIDLLFKTGYAGRRTELEHVLKYHGNLPEWQDYMDALKKQIAQEEDDFGITANEIRNPSQIGKWPTPGRVKQRLERRNPQPAIIPFIEYVNSWMYRYLSGQTHLNLQGIIDRGMFFSEEIARQSFGDDWRAPIERHLINYRLTSIYSAVTLMLAICSEIEIHFNYGLSERCRYLWAFFAEYTDISKDFWKTRYEAALPI